MLHAGQALQALQIARAAARASRCLAERSEFPMLGGFALRRGGERACTGDGTACDQLLQSSTRESGSHHGHDAVQALLQLGERLVLTLPLELLLTADEHLHAAICHRVRLAANGHGPRALQRLVRA